VQVLSLQPIEERSSSGLGSRAFNPLTGVRIPYALPVLYVFDIKHTVPAHERNSRAGRGYLWAVSSAAEQRLYTANVGGSIPSRPTIFLPVSVCPVYYCKPYKARFSCVRYMAREYDVDKTEYFVV
jgi:hypothetical protein